MLFILGIFPALEFIGHLFEYIILSGFFCYSTFLFSYCFALYILLAEEINLVFELLEEILTIDCWDLAGFELIEIYRIFGNMVRLYFTFLYKFQYTSVNILIEIPASKETNLMHKSQCQ